MLLKTKPVRDKKYLAYLTTLPCALCRQIPCEPAHQRLLSGWGGEKPDDRHALPMCRDCHDWEHRRGVVTTWNYRRPGKFGYFPDKHTLRTFLGDLCEKYWLKYVGEKNGN
jgi:hypothetical protein